MHSREFIRHIFTKDGPQLKRHSNPLMCGPADNSEYGLGKPYTPNVRT